MSKNSPSKGQHGMGARGNGKLMYFHANIAQMVRHSKDKMLRKSGKPVEYRQPDGHWVHS
jgi:hypothetical protein